MQVEAEDMEAEDMDRDIILKLVDKSGGKT
jgi:hypothetical protein